MREDVSLLDVISSLFEGDEYFDALPVGVVNVELVTSESVRVMFSNRVDYNLLCRVSLEEGYSIDASWYTPRIVDKGHIIARVGSRSDPGEDHNIFIYLFPASGIMSTYMRAAAIGHKIIDPKTNRIDMGRLLRYNLKVIKLVEKYRKIRYQNLIEKSRV
ncbi:MAG: hypothetical protein QXX94_05220 [Candidatus Bathyarchaeia archaeon]